MTTRTRFFIDPAQSDEEILAALQGMSVQKHYAPVHPGTGTDQTIHDPQSGGGGVDVTPDALDTAPPPTPEPAAGSNPIEAPNETEPSLRPQTLDDFVGQDHLKEQLRIHIDSAKTRGAPLDHMLFGGPPGLGKTTLANIMANEMGSNFHVVTGPAIRNPNDLMAKLAALQDGDILFIDEIHALPRDVQEILYPAMEDFQLDFKLHGDGPPVRMNLPEFTLLGATTRAGELQQPLRDRFGLIGDLDFYEPTRLAEIVNSTATKLDIDLGEGAAIALAERSRGTPRIANNLTEWVRDYSIAREGGAQITTSTVDSALQIAGIDHAGLSGDQRQYLRALSDTGTSGVRNIAATMGQDEVNVSDAIEPYLIREGYVTRTPRGRLITDKGVQHLEELIARGWVEKRDRLTRPAQISADVRIAKSDDYKNLVFGWASVAFTKDGTQVVDKQGHMIDVDDLENAAYNFVIKSYGTGDMHRSEGFGELVESMVFTPEKMELLNLPPDSLPSAWWVGFRVPPEHHEAVRSGKRRMFSIEGNAKLRPVDD